jgi:hypothetical protein
MKTSSGNIDVGRSALTADRRSPTVSARRASSKGAMANLPSVSKTTHAAPEKDLYTLEIHGDLVE